MFELQTENTKKTTICRLFLKRLIVRGKIKSYVSSSADAPRSSDVRTTKISRFSDKILPSIEEEKITKNYFLHL